MSRIVASPWTIGGMAEEIVIPANAATQIQVSSVVIRANGSLLTTSSGRPTAANSRTNGLPTSRPTSVTRKIPRLLSGCIHRSMNAWLSTNVRIVSTENVADRPDFEGEAGHFLGSTEHQAGDGDRQCHHDGGLERDVADQHPVHDPRREADEDTHGCRV